MSFPQTTDSLLSPVLTAGVAAILAVLLAASPLAAQVSPAVIALVDLGAVMLFHPKMANYDPHRAAFLMDGKLIPASREKKPAPADHQNALAELTKKRGSIEAQLNDIRRGLDDKLRQEAEAHGERILKAATGTRAVLENQNLVRVAQINQEFALKARVLFADLRDLDQQIRTMQKTDPSGQFSSPQETRTIFLALLDEVKETVKAVAAARRVAVVLDAGPALGLPGEATTDVPVPLPPENPYKTALNEPPPPDFEPRGVVENHYQAIGEGIYNWVRNRSAILGPVRNEVAAARVLMGGVDITEEVITNLLTKYKVNQSTQWVILNAYRATR
ncbi:MAG: hypothetical protein GX442_22880 [Candidatus Riflebacteria bacterium]|nr:hypothetical protein [Candidatus Riflebacteria bacterium]